MKLLAVDTSTEACTVALMIGEKIREKYAIAPREHARLVLPMVDSLLAEAELPVTDLDGIALGIGPGSFTGVRIAAGVVQGIAFGADLPVFPVSTLAVMAQGIFRETGEANILPAIDARMHEVYWGCYQADITVVRPAWDDMVVPPDSVKLPGTSSWVGVGTGWEMYATELAEAVKERRVRNMGRYFPHAQDLALLGSDMLDQGKGVLPERVQPAYLRNKVADER